MKDTPCVSAHALLLQQERSTDSVRERESRSMQVENEQAILKVLWRADESGVQRMPAMLCRPPIHSILSESSIAAITK